ncbi:MAG: GNAT family N-acetyltransferase [Bryobacterales bacterium]|nr:GNAT family N-acetyltransferase [Bryobacterales bacterium]
MDVRIRTVLPSESTLVFSFLTLAARMQESGEPIQKALRDHELTRYWQDWGRQGDLGLVAESDSVGYPISCAWVRLFSREEAGADYVGEDIPELAIGTIPAARGMGVGTKILQALLSRCKTRYTGVSLSVRMENPAIRLYERLGFRKTSATPIVNRVGTESVVMLLNFDWGDPGHDPNAD